MLRSQWDLYTVRDRNGNVRGFGKWWQANKIAKAGNWKIVRYLKTR